MGSKKEEKGEEKGGQGEKVKEKVLQKIEEMGRKKDGSEKREKKKFPGFLGSGKTKRNREKGSFSFSGEF